MPTVAKLKQSLAALGLPTSGLKAELLARLASASAAPESSSAAAPAATKTASSAAAAPRSRQRRWKKTVAKAVLALSLVAGVGCALFWERIEPLIQGTKEPYCPVYTPLPGEALVLADPYESQMLGPLDSAIYAVEVAIERGHTEYAQQLWDQLAEQDIMKDARADDLEAMKVAIAAAVAKKKVNMAANEAAAANLWLNPGGVAQEMWVDPAAAQAPPLVEATEVRTVASLWGRPGPAGAAAASAEGVGVGDELYK